VGVRLWGTPNLVTVTVMEMEHADAVCSRVMASTNRHYGSLCWRSSLVGAPKVRRCSRLVVLGASASMSRIPCVSC
jgi:hypothetical protein